MNRETIAGFLRALLAFAGGASVFGPWLNDHLAGEIIGAIAVLGAAAWSWWEKRTPQMVKAVDARPEVKGVITQDNIAGKELAKAIPSPTVVPAGTPAAVQVAKSTNS